MRSPRFLLPLAFAAALLFAAAPAGAQLPPSKGAPKAGEKLPDFTLPDTANKPVKFSDLLKPPAGEPSAAGGSWVILIFYRGYW
jgi:hypothetical protein